MIKLNTKYKNLIDFLEKESPFQPDISLILGSGLGDFAENIETKKTISTNNIPDYPPSTIIGHDGKIHFSEYLDKKLLIFQGRIHLYEGYPIYQCILPVFISERLGCKKIIITNAAGGVNENFIPGDLMICTSLNGINIKKELTHLLGISSVDGKNNFLNFPSLFLNKKIMKASIEEKIDLKEGVYWYTKGPSYETPAEIKMVRKFGGDAVGMSTVHEAVLAGFYGMEVSVISVITNFAAGISSRKLSHSDVTETANLVKDKFARLIKRSIKNL